MLARARGHIAAGRFAEALAVVEAVSHHGPLDGAWDVVQGDGLRGLGRAGAAADAYIVAASKLSGVERIEVGYAAAYLRFHDLHDADGALAALMLAAPDAAGSPLEERGLALHVQILAALGRSVEARPLAQRYLERFAHSDLAGDMRTLLARIPAKIP
jgi:hypothetical protein